MAIKESSDELNPAVTVSPSAVAPRQRRTGADYLALAIATCGVGYFPIAPGTLGSLVAIAVYVPLEYFVRIQWMPSSTSALPAEMCWLTIRLFLIFVVTMVGVWGATRAERLLQIKDPGIVVIDEVAGQMIALLSIPLFVPGWLPVFTAFIFFRAFDIWKPYPIRRMEALESGLGIMADDVLAGIYALILNSILVSLQLRFV